MDASTYNLRFMITTQYCIRYKTASVSMETYRRMEIELQAFYL
jgi:hypothetical protein